MKSWLDVFFDGFRWYRRLRGGKWERTAACCACPIEMWHRVELFRPCHWPVVVKREWWADG